MKKLLLLISISFFSSGVIAQNIPYSNKQNSFSINTHNFNSQKPKKAEKFGKNELKKTEDQAILKVKSPEPNMPISKPDTSIRYTILNKKSN